MRLQQRFRRILYQSIFVATNVLAQHRIARPARAIHALCLRKIRLQGNREDAANHPDSVQEFGRSVPENELQTVSYSGPNRPMFENLKYSDFGPRGRPVGGIS